MQELIYWTSQQLEVKSLHPLLIIGIFIVTFLAIHPFQDGNGRLSRILTTFLLLKLWYIYVPYSSLESNKESYYLALRCTQQSLKTSSYDFNSWLMFFLRSLQKQNFILNKRCHMKKC
ncbi:Fic family protein [Wolbachia endosymbiont (group A) of Ennomos erosarius]|uniref:Fic family protein n=1 Tax=Wolbachia endosymbiont (group A) of Ennomos erosarius TaxID=3066174 RepID=UPI003340070A